MCNLQERTILLVEDDDVCVYLLRKHLSKSGVINQIIRFNDGEKFLEYSACNLPEDLNEKYLLILDLHLPGISGSELLGLLRISKIETIRNLPVIVFSTSTLTEDRCQCEKMGATYCVKCFDEPFELAEIIHNKLDTHSIMT